MRHRPVPSSRTARTLAGIAAGWMAACSPAAPPPARAPQATPEASADDVGSSEPSAPDAAATTNAEGAGSAGAEGLATSGDPFAPDSAPAPAAEAAATPAADGRAGSEGGPEASEGMISFFEIGRGDRVADLGGLYGYSLEPILDAVGGAGVVYARLRPGLAPDAVPYSQPDRSHQGELIWMKTPMTAPFSKDAERLNAVTMLFAYHSIVAAGQDRKAFNDRVLRALVPGGTYIIVDHASRIDDTSVRSEVEAAGFKFIEAADFVTNAARRPDQAAPSQYVLKFKKPK
ncbi:MAG TPA: hypothetical protein VMG12_35775 [Polyangiaceae bacterium]|nr:hypothetical protein [Polyangiaceae bacterium]